MTTVQRPRLAIQGCSAFILLEEVGSQAGNFSSFLPWLVQSAVSGLGSLTGGKQQQLQEERMAAIGDPAYRRETFGDKVCLLCW